MVNVKKLTNRVYHVHKKNSYTKFFSDIRCRYTTYRGRIDYSRRTMGKKDKSEEGSLRDNGQNDEFTFLGNWMFLSASVTYLLMVANAVMWSLASSDIFIFNPSVWLYILATEGGLILIVNISVYVMCAITSPPKRKVEGKKNERELYSKRHFDGYLSFTVVCLGTIATIAGKLYGYFNTYGDKLDVDSFAAERDGILARADWRSTMFLSSFSVVIIAYAFYWVVIAERQPVFNEWYADWRKSTAKEMTSKKHKTSVPKDDF